MPYSIYTRYALAPEDSWVRLDQVGTESAAMECMKYPPVTLLDDTLIQIIDDYNQPVAFGMIRDQEGFIAPPVASIPGFDEKSREIQTIAGMNWEVAWLRMASPKVMLTLAARSKTNPRLLVKLMHDFILANVDTKDDAILMELSAIRTWLLSDEKYPADEATKISMYCMNLARNAKVVSVSFLSHAASCVMPDTLHLVGIVNQIPRSTERDKWLLRRLKSDISIADLIRNIVREIQLQP